MEQIKGADTTKGEEDINISLLNPNPATIPAEQPTKTTIQHPQDHSGLTVSAWNCRDLTCAAPYINHLAESCDIIVLSEHWLWPHSLHKLDDLASGFSSYGCSDKRLNMDSNLTRGCGGVAILWKENLSVTPVRSVDSDRFMAIQLLLASSTLLSIVAVYLPSSDHPMSEFAEYLVQLESLISSLQASGPVMVVGDFNAHLGSLGCHRNSDNTNRAGHMLFDVICRCGLFVASQSAFADGECYTFENGSHKTTVDYCLVDSGYAYLLKSCSTLSPDPLNLSDHLPLRVSLDVSTTKFTTPKSPPALNWQ